MEEVREEEEQVAGDSADDEEGQQVYSEMLQRINTEVAALQAEEEQEEAEKGQQRSPVFSENRKDSLPNIMERLQSPPAKSAIAS